MNDTHSHDYWFGMCACGQVLHPSAAWRPSHYTDADLVRIAREWPAFDRVDAALIHDLADALEAHLEEPTIRIEGIAND